MFSYFFIRGQVTTVRQRKMWILAATILSLVLVFLIYKNGARLNAVTWGNLFVLDAVFPLLQHRIPNLHRRLAFFSFYALSAGFIATSYFQLLHNMQINRIDYAEVQAAVQRLSLPGRHLLIAHQGFDYFYCYYRKGDAFHFLAEDKHRGREVFRVLYGFPAVTLRRTSLR